MTLEGTTGDDPRRFYVNGDDLRLFNANETLMTQDSFQYYCYICRCHVFHYHEHCSKCGQIIEKCPECKQEYH